MCKASSLWDFVTVTLRNQYEDLACASTPCHAVCKILTGLPLGEDLPISVLLSFLFNSFILVACLLLTLESREARGLKLGAGFLSVFEASFPPGGALKPRWGQLPPSR